MKKMFLFLSAWTLLAGFTGCVVKEEPYHHHHHEKVIIEERQPVLEVR